MGPTLWILLSLAVAGVLLLMLWSARRHESPVLNLQCELPIDRLMPSLAGLSLSHCVQGNAVELLENGAFYDTLIGAISGARQSVHFETFLWKDGVLGRRLAHALAGRARAGVKVRLTLDDTGCRRMGKDVRRELEQAGCAIVRFHKRTLKNLGVLNDRDHRKLAVIDGREAFVGGHCIVDEWLGEAQDSEHYADLSVRLRGPIVHSVQAAFSENWSGGSGEMFVGDAYYPPLAPAGDLTMFAAYAKPEGSAPAVKLLHHAAICLAKQRLWIQNPYFIPEPEAIEAFGEAVARGVDVRVLMPSAGGSDNPLVQHAGHRNFESLLRRGVRLFEYPHTLLHQKVMTIDRAFCVIGSSNFDDRSFDTNDEISLGILAPSLAGQLDAVFEKYAAHAREIELARWHARSLWHKLVDNTVYVANELM